MRTSSCVRTFAVCLAAATGILTASPPAGAATLSVPAGGDLQAAINAAQPGDVILLAAGATYTGNFVLPDKGAATAFITIRSAAADSQLPGPGVRITPAYSPLLPKIRSSNTSAAMRTRPGAHHWRLQFLEFLANVQNAGDILDLGDGSSAQNTLSSVPYDLVVDRVYIHGDPAHGQKRGIGLNSQSTDILNSWISDIKSVGQDSQAIAGWNGPGPYHIENNYMEAAGNGFLIGGDDPKIPNLTASNIVFRRNTITRPVSWKAPIVATPAAISAAAGSGGTLAAGTYGYSVVARRPVSTTTAKSSPTPTVTATVSAGGSVTISWSGVADATDYVVYGRTPTSQSMYWIVKATTFTDTGAAGTAGSPSATGTRWQVKNLFELKNARGVQVDGNLMENNWKQAQNGYAVLFTVRNQYGGCTWCVVEDVTFEYNTVRHTGAGIQILGVDDVNPSQRTNNVRIRNNLFADIDKAAWGGNGYFLLVAHGPLQSTIDHNTIIQGSASGAVYVYGTAAYGFVYTNNVSKHSTYGIIGQNHAVGNDSIATYFPDGVITRNVLAGGKASSYPATNLFPTVTEYEAQFVSYGGGDYHLVAGSSWIGAGTDGNDLGADLAALSAASGTASPALAITTTTLPDATADVPYSAALQASGGVTPYRWTSQSALPPGLAIDAGTGTLSGTSTVSGSFTIAVSVTDAAGTVASKSLSLTIIANLSPLAITGTTLSEGTVGVAYSGSATAAGGEPLYTWSLASGTLPPGLALDAASGAVTGTPGQAGTWAATLAVTDSGVPARQATAPISIAVVAPLRIDTASVPEGTTTVAYTAALSASGGTAPYSWSISSGALPPGLTLNAATGTIAGTPSMAGSWIAGVRVVDASTVRQASTSFSFAVFDPLTIATTSLPAATAGQAYSGALAASGGKTPYGWRLGSGSLPPGIALDAAGMLAGTPTSTGSWTFAVIVDDSGAPAREATQTLTLAVNATQDVPPTVAITSPVQGQSFTLGTSAALAAEAKDADGSVTRVEYFANGSSVAVATVPPFSASWQPQATGSFTVTAVATDDRGASTTSAAVGITVVAAVVTPTPAADVVLYAVDAQTIAGNYKLVGDSAAASGKRLWNRSGKTATAATAASARPKTYAEWTFFAEAGTPYRLWLRGKADGNSPLHDSVFVQFSDSVANGVAVYRIGTTNATPVNLEDCSGCGLSGWGWQDNGFGAGVLGPTITFATGGTHTIRIQPREDGFSIDQVVLSPERFLASSPGALQNDTTIVAK